MHRLGFLFVLLIFIIAGCALQYPDRGKLISQVDIPELDSNKSRVFFYYGNEWRAGVRIVSDKNGALETLGLFNYLNECTYVDLIPGDYNFRVGNSHFQIATPITKVSLGQGRTYYIEVAYNSDNFMSYYYNRRFNLILLDPEQGKEDIRDCFYVGEKNIK